MPHTRIKKRLHNIKMKHPQIVEIKVRMDCEGCERRVRKSVEGMKGVTKVEVERKKQSLLVTGYVDPDEVLDRVRQRTGKKAEMWPSLPYDVVERSRPYITATPEYVYDKQAPVGYVRKGHESPETSNMALNSSSATEVKYTTAFSDDNPNACLVM
ncbi:unnamed protein product [Ilex paraguariensis]